MVSTSNVWVQGNATCTSTNGHVTTGSYTVVQITSSFWSSGLLPIPISNKVLSAEACYPTSVI